MTVQMSPPATGRRNTITINGRAYSSTPGVGIPVREGDALALAANGWHNLIYDQPYIIAFSDNQQIAALRFL